MGDRVIKYLSENLTRNILIGLFALQAVCFGEASTEAEVKTPVGDINSLFVVSIGRDLDPENDNASITLEPSISYQATENLSLGFYTAIDRPFDKFKNFSVPKTSFSAALALKPVGGFKPGVSAAVQLRNLHDWGDEGHAIRNYVSGSMSTSVLPSFTLSLKVSPFVQLNKYAFRTSGKSNTKFGMVETLTGAYQYKILNIELSFSLAQSKSDVWNNDFAAGQAISLNLTDTLTWGVSHEVLTSRVDSTTGFYRNARLFDGRESRVATYIEASL